MKIAKVEKIVEFQVVLSQQEVDHVTAMLELAEVLNADFVKKAFNITTDDGITEFKTLNKNLFESLIEIASQKNFVVATIQKE